MNEASAFQRQRQCRSVDAQGSATEGRDPDWHAIGKRAGRGGGSAPEWLSLPQDSQTAGAEKARRLQNKGEHQGDPGSEEHPKEGETSAAAVPAGPRGEVLRQ